MTGFERILSQGIALAVLSTFAFASHAADGLGLDSGSLRAQLIAVRHATLSAEMGGKIDRLHVKEGQSVKKGQVLAEFNCAVPRAQLSKARIEISMAANTHEGNLKLKQMNAIGSVEYDNSGLQVQKAKAEVSYLRALIERCTVNAPYSGQVSQVYVQESEFVQLGTQLLDIQEGSQLQLEFIVPSAWLKGVKAGKAFEVTIEDTGKKYSAVVAYTNVKVDPMSQSVKVVGRIEGKHPELLAGMSGLVHLQP